MKDLKPIPYPVKDFERFSHEDTTELLPYGVEREHILTEDEFEAYREDNKAMIEDVLENVDYHGYKFYTVLFLNDTADEVYIKI